MPGDFHPNSQSTITRGVTRGARGAQFPGRQFTMGALNHYGGAEKSQQYYKYFNTVNLLSNKLRFDHGGAKLRPWGRQFDHGGAKLVFAPGAI